VLVYWRVAAVNGGFLISSPSPAAKDYRRVLRLLYWPYKWLIFGPLLALSTCLFVGMGIVMLPFVGDLVVNRTVLVWWARFNSLMIPMRVTVLGRENIAKGRSYVIVSNHQSLIDSILLVGWLKTDIKWVMKKELRKVPVFGYAAEKGGQILIDRSNTRVAYESLRRAEEKIAGGTSIVILPEGTRSRTGQLGEFKKGAFWLSQNLGLPMLPVSIINTRNILPPDTLDLFPGRVILKIHPPVEVEQYGEASMERLMLDVRHIIRSGLGSNES
jgi:1-acyl-sn-glycerol-3-phosphate acyltransferase